MCFSCSKLIIWHFSPEEEPEVEKKRQNLIIESAQSKAQLKEIEDWAMRRGFRWNREALKDLKVRPSSLEISVCDHRIVPHWAYVWKFGIRKCTWPSIQIQEATTRHTFCRVYVYIIYSIHLYRILFLRDLLYRLYLTDFLRAFISLRQDKILELLSNSKGNILDDEELITTLANSKVTSTRYLAETPVKECFVGLGMSRYVFRYVSAFFSMLI